MRTTIAIIAILCIAITILWLWWTKRQASHSAEASITLTPSDPKNLKTTQANSFHLSCEPDQNEYRIEIYVDGSLIRGVYLLTNESNIQTDQFLDTVLALGPTECSRQTLTFPLFRSTPKTIVTTRSVDPTCMASFQIPRTLHHDTCSSKDSQTAAPNPLILVFYVIAHDEHTAWKISTEITPTISRQKPTITLKAESTPPTDPPAPRFSLEEASHMVQLLGLDPINHRLKTSYNEDSGR